MRLSPLLLVISHNCHSIRANLPSSSLSSSSSPLLPSSISSAALRATSSAATTTTTTGTSLRAMSSSKDAPEIPDYPRTSVGYEPRYNGPPEDEMTAEQKEIRDAIVASRPRTGLSGPFGPWLAVPAIAQPAQSLGRACRYGTSLSFQESELVILLTGAKARSHAEFDIHVGEALKSGWSYNVIQAIPRDDAFSLQAVQEKLIPLLDNDRQKIMAAFAAELLDTYTISDETYEATKKVFDGKDSVLVEITSIVGYYTYVAFTLNTFRIPSQKAAAATTAGEKRKRDEEENDN